MTADRIRVAIVDDHPALRDGTAMLLGKEDDLEVVAAEGTLDAARALISATESPDVLVLDIRLDGERGLELLKSPSDVESRPAIVVWTGFDVPQYATYALQAGAAGFVLKTAPLSELIEAIRIAADGGIRFNRTPAAASRGLSPREFDVLGGVVKGLSNDEIASAMGVTTRAVESHLTRLYERYDLRSRAELAARSVREGWLDIPPA